MLVKDFDLDVLCKIDQFRYFSNVNGLSLLDGTYLERLITYFYKEKEFLPCKEIVDLKDLKVILDVNTTEGIKGIFVRLNNMGALSFVKIGKYHKQKYIIIISPLYIQFFFLGR
ncbi:MAG: hypothetical protein LBE72_06230 [Rickettsia sp.]|jgi:hypothetical protein|nr:hypothetical protein [Rickettsia sp.]